MTRYRPPYIRRQLVKMEMQSLKEACRMYDALAACAETAGHGAKVAIRLGSVSEARIQAREAASYAAEVLRHLARIEPLIGVWKWSSTQD